LSAVACGRAEEGQPPADSDGGAGGVSEQPDGGPGGDGAKEEEYPPGFNEHIPVEFPRVVGRSLTLGEDGKYVLGEAVDIDGAQTCVIARRDSDAVFEPYEDLEEPLCVTTRAGETIQSTGIFPYSDVVVTVSKDGYLPVVFTHRVGSFSYIDPVFAREAVTVLFERGQKDLFEPLANATSASPDEEDAAFVTMEFNVITGTTLSEDVELSLTMSSQRLPLASGVEAEFVGSDGFSAKTPEYDRSPVLVRLVADHYRVKTSHPSAVCDAMSVGPFSVWGLRTGNSQEIELLTLPGHVTHLVGRCACAFPSETAVLIDPPSCTYEEP
jgi:hypothetical protein